jgi:hypothetical protein
MNMKGKIDLYAKIRHEYRWGVGTIRGLAEMFKVHRRLVRDALDNPLPPKRKIPLRQHTSLASAIPLIDVLLLADRDVPYFSETFCTEHPSSNPVRIGRTQSGGFDCTWVRQEEKD